MVVTNVIRTAIHITIFANVVYCAEYYLKLSSSAPAIEGVNVTLYADVYKSDGSRPKNETFSWEWWVDDGSKQTFETQTPSAEWKYAFPKTKKNDNGKIHWLGVVASKYYIYDTLLLPIANNKLAVNITSILNGELVLTQNGTERTTEYISSATPLNQKIQISDGDMASIVNVSYITVYWFVDCEYVGQTDEWNATNVFKTENETHNIEALLVASFEPRPQPVPTTTTTTTTTTEPTTTTTSTTTPSTTTTTTTKTTTTTNKPTTTSTTPPSTTTTPTTPSTTTTSTTTTTKPPKRRRRDTTRNQFANQTVEMLMQNGEIDPKDLINGTIELPTTTYFPPTTHVPYFIDQPYVCFNKSNIAPDPKKIYGYFSRNVAVRNPLTTPIVTGDLWIKREDGMTLNISWSGSPPYYFCYDFKYGPHNMTANETCADDAWEQTSQPWLTIHRFSLTEYSITILFQVRNEITNHTKFITVNTYEVQKQSQLSVIVVPVAFILCAIVAIIFGVANYVQTRNRLTVEVADFNFGETSSLDLEYKSFIRRLYDSIREALPHRRLIDDVDDTDDPSMRYGVMS